MSFESTLLPFCVHNKPQYVVCTDALSATIALGLNFQLVPDVNQDKSLKVILVRYVSFKNGKMWKESDKILPK